MNNLVPGTRTTGNNGTYTGNGNANRGVAHGLNRPPVFVCIEATGTNQGLKFEVGACDSIQEFNTGANSLAVTAADATYFYVGNAGSMQTSANTNLQAYRWAAF